MASELVKRALLYGSAVLCLGGLALAVVKTDSDADVLTLLSSADVQLRLAYAMPAVDQQGRTLTGREPLIATAEGFLADIERIEPGLACVAEFQGFAHMLRGRFLDAASCYERAQGCKDCEAEQRDVLVFNQARMLANGGNGRQALAVFGKNATALDARFGAQRCLEEATILRELGEREQSRQRLDQVTRASAVEPMVWLQAGVQYLALGHREAAEAALNKAVTDVPIADYHLAKLKVAAGEIDNGFELLERVAKVLPSEVRQLVREEPAAWAAVATSARFQELTSVRPAQPLR
jgi:tetratricopeptide (TPR) repeat protein